MKTLRDTIVILFAMSGMFLTQLTPLRVLVTAAIGGATLLLALSPWRAGLPVALLAFAGGFAVRYAFLFLSFGHGGIAERLKRSLGLESGFAAYEALTALQFFARGITFSWLLEATRLPIAPLGSDWSAPLHAAGLLVAAAGMSMNIWATLVVGIPTYFYRDLFLGAEGPRTVFKVEGPYRWLRNPMYGFGQLAAYGIALSALSPICLLATALNQAAMYLFNWYVEQPHVRLMLGLAETELAPALSAEISS
jgi:protein-S-isoprenylcysteine O-methyltransferase Ste14